MLTRFPGCLLAQHRIDTWRRRLLTSGLGLLLIAAMAAGCTNATATPRGNPAVSAPQLSERGHFLVSYRAEHPPIKLNDSHTWLLTVATPDDTPVTGAQVIVTGGMPAHNHGLPTQPQVLTGAAPGEYRVEGMRFQMPGEWIVTVAITSGTVTDQVAFPFVLQ